MPTGCLLAAVMTLLVLSPVSAEETPAKPALLSGAAALAGQRVMVLGDSNSQDGRYLSYCEYYLQKQNPTLDFDFVNVGLASETTSGLTEEGHPGPRPCIHDRLDLALTDVKPQLVIACYGMNDGIYKPLNEERMAAFQSGVTRLVEKCQAAGAQVILITPPAYDVDCEGGTTAKGFDYNTVLGAFAEWELKTRPAGATVINIHTPLSQQVKPCREAKHPLHNPGDGVHPAEMGHFVMAKAILAGLQLPLAEGDLAQQLADAQADPLYKLVRQRQSTRAHGWLQYIGYTRVNKTTKPHENDIPAIETQAAEQLQEINKLRRSGR